VSSTVLQCRSIVLYNEPALADLHNKELGVTDEKRASSVIDDGAASRTNTNDLEKQDDVGGKDGVDLETDSVNVKAEAEKERDPNVVDYDGPDDPENPYNWSLKKKWTNGALLSALTFVT
jgi:hypothetical protein